METNISRFSNLGNTCYQNSVLHPLIHSPDGFIEYILSGDYLNQLKKSKTESEIKETILFQFHRILNSFFFNQEIILNLHKWNELCGKKNETFEGFQQQDSQEFLSFLIDTMIEELGTEYKEIPRLAINNSSWSKEKLVLNLLANQTYQRFHRKKFSLLVPMFNGLFRSKIECNCCGFESNSFEPFTIFPINLPEKKEESIKLEDCLSHFSHPEELDKDNLITCSGCCQKSFGKKTVSIWKLPKYLIFQIKRFKHDMFGRITTKDNTKVEYPLELNLNSFLDKASQYSDSENQYFLYGVTIHLGVMMGGFSAGHYISLLRNRSDLNWYIYNDDKTPLKLKETNLIHPQAYLLFYSRKDF
jgi:ubiquitin carboxyl-terminal hydrolase 8